jgi:hypothetical protein
VCTTFAVDYLATALTAVLAKRFTAHPRSPTNREDQQNNDNNTPM